MHHFLHHSLLFHIRFTKSVSISSVRSDQNAEHFGKSADVSGNVEALTRRCSQLVFRVVEGLNQPGLVLQQAEQKKLVPYTGRKTAICISYEACWKWSLKSGTMVACIIDYNVYIMYTNIRIYIYVCVCVQTLTAPLYLHISKFTVLVLQIVVLVSWGRCSKRLNKRSWDLDQLSMRAVSSWRGCVNWDTRTATLTQGMDRTPMIQMLYTYRKRQFVVYCYCSYNFLYSLYYCFMVIGVIIHFENACEPKLVPATWAWQGKGTYLLWIYAARNK